MAEGGWALPHGFYVCSGSSVREACSDTALSQCLHLFVFSDSSSAVAREEEGMELEEEVVVDKSRYLRP